MQCTGTQRATCGRAMRPVVAPARSRCVMRAAEPEANTTADPEQVKAPPLSLFTPMKNLPPDGKLVGDKDKPKFQGEHAYVYDTACPTCSGTGFARQTSGSKRVGRGNGALTTCVVCKGIGYVRNTTARPQVIPEASVEQLTLAREHRLPGEPEEQETFVIPPEPEPDATTKWRMAEQKQMEEQEAAAQAPVTAQTPRSG